MKVNIEEQPQGQWGKDLKNGNPRCDLSLLPRCNATAKTTGVRCKQAAMKNGKCHWHGGKSTGAPVGNRNALKNGFHTREAIENGKAVQQFLKDCRAVLDTS